MVFLGKVLIFLILAALCIAAAALCVILLCNAFDDLSDLGIIRETDPMEYRRGYEHGRSYAMKYPMGQLTFPIACSHCKNVGSDKCYRCKEERESGFELKTKEESL